MNSAYMLVPPATASGFSSAALDGVTEYRLQ
jgi:hypothetical protein